MSALEAQMMAVTDEMVALLAGAGLPISDLHDADHIFLRFDDGVLGGFGGIEGNGIDRIVRSMVVVPERRKDGIGASMLTQIEDHARALGVQRLHLLTSTAALFFARFGYIEHDRQTAPDFISKSQQFASLCPAIATYMVKAL